MARLFGTGFELGGIPMSLVGTPDLASSNARTGTYALQINANSEGAYVNLGTAKTALYVRFAYRPAAVDATYQCPLLTFLNEQQEQMLAVTMQKNSFTLSVIRPDDGFASTTLATGSTLLVSNWYVIEVYVSTPDNTTGVVQVKVDGALDIDFEGDTLGGYAPANFQFVALAKPGGTGPLSLFSPSLYGLFDDFVVDDAAWPGRGGIELLKPVAAGTTTGLTPSAGDNYAAVDDVPADDDTTYVESATVDLFDTYALSDCTRAGTVNAVYWWARAKLDEAGAGNIAPVLRVGGTDYTGTDQGIDTNYAYKYQVYETNPADSEAWAIADLDALEAGAKVR